MGKRTYQSFAQSSKKSRSNGYSTGARGASTTSVLRRARTSSAGRMWPYQKAGMSMLWDPFPAKVTAVMRYNATITLAADQAGAPVHHIFRANSIFDPDQTGLGHQPYGHDTYMQIYNHYKVNSATIVVTSLSNNKGMLGCTVTDDTTVNGDFDTVKEIKGTRMTPLNDGSEFNGKVVQYFNRNQIFDQNIDGLGANFGQNPSEKSYFDVWYTAQTEVATSTLVCNVCITYNVSMWELKDLGNS